MLLVLTALAEEVTPLVAAMEVQGTDRIGQWTVHTGRLGQRLIAVSATGIGKLSAFRATELLSRELMPREIIAGGLAVPLIPSLRQGDVVVASQVIQFDVDPSAFGRHIGPRPELTEAIDCDHQMVERSVRAFEAHEGDRFANCQLVVGPIASGDSFVTNRQEIRRLHTDLGAVAADMEGVAIGLGARSNNTPFTLVRVLAGGGTTTTADLAADSLADGAATLTEIIRIGERAPALP